MKSGKIVILQTCVPDYRLATFSALAARFPEFTVLGGGDYFAPSVKTAAYGRPWFGLLKNVFIARRSFLWQVGAWRSCKDVDVLVVEWNPRVLSTLCLVIWRSMFGRPSIVWGHADSHGRLAGLGRLARRLLAMRSSGIIAYTHSQARLCRIRFPGVPVWTAPNSSVPESEVVPVSGGVAGCNVLYVGRLTAEKKPKVLVSAWAEVEPKLPDTSWLIIVGDGPERRGLEELASSKRAKRIRFVGHVSEVNRLRDLYESAFASVSPGYVGLSVVQACAFGVPMIISRHERHSPEIEVCREGINCVYFQTDSPFDLASKLYETYTNRGSWRSKANEISDDIRKNYTVEAMAAGIATAISTFWSKNIKAAIIWEQYGPYHIARVGRLQENGRIQCIPIEIACKTNTYLWARGDSRVEVHSLELMRPAEAVCSVVVYVRAVRMFKRLRPDVVFVPSYWPATSFAVLLAAQRVGACTVMMNDSHEGTAKASGLRLLAKRRMVAAFDAALVAGTPQTRYFGALGMPADRIFSKYDVIDNCYFGARANAARADEDRVRHARKLPRRYFLNVGRMEEKKNLPMLVSAYSMFAKAVGNPPALVFVGSGSCEGMLRAQCDQLGLRVRNAQTGGDGAAEVVFYPFTQADNLPSFYALADAFILPSIRDEWGLVVNEAMACGVPVIVSRAAGCCEDLVHEGDTGFSFSPDNVAELQTCLERIWRRPEEARAIGDRAREFIQHWGLPAFAENAERASFCATGIEVV